MTPCAEASFSDSSSPVSGSFASERSFNSESSRLSSATEIFSAPYSAAVTLVSSADGLVSPSPSAAVRWRSRDVSSATEFSSCSILVSSAVVEGADSTLPVVVPSANEVVATSNPTKAHTILLIRISFMILFSSLCAFISTSIRVDCRLLPIPQLECRSCISPRSLFL